ncbi:MAG TPA: hypothetical protein VGK19_04480 [Capsulimonadaceae bacterium]|jgi:hypothetical protein
MTTVSEALGINYDDIAHLRNTCQKLAAHPLVALDDEAGQVCANTVRASRIIARNNRPWLDSIKRRILDATHSNASSALAEVRAYGALLEIGLPLAPEPSVAGKKVRPDFELSDGKTSAVVEAHCKQFDTRELERLRIFHQQAEQAGAKLKESGKRFHCATTSVTPLGRPEASKPSDSILTNAISRICGIKSGERQSDEAKPFILWLDLQDLTGGGLPIAYEQLAPIYSQLRDGDVGSGALWYALYGKRDDPMVESGSPEYRVARMLHHGRFAQSRAVSAVVYSLPRGTVLMEHPDPTHRISAMMRASLIGLPFFMLDRSILEWEPGLVAQLIELEKTRVQATVLALKRYDDERWADTTDSECRYLSPGS